MHFKLFLKLIIIKVEIINRCELTTLFFIIGFLIIDFQFRSIENSGNLFF
jgi:hypothetical protein